MQITQYKQNLAQDDDLLFRLIKNLLQIIRQNHNNNESIEALKCLGFLGPLRLNKISFYFDIDYFDDDVSRGLRWFTLR